MINAYVKGVKKEEYMIWIPTENGIRFRRKRDFRDTALFISRSDGTAGRCPEEE